MVLVERITVAFLSLLHSVAGGTGSALPRGLVNLPERHDIVAFELSEAEVAKLNLLLQNCLRPPLFWVAVKGLKTKLP